MAVLEERRLLMWCCEGLVRDDVAEEHTTSIFRIEKFLV
jgi:hypothetical protein